MQILVIRHAPAEDAAFPGSSDFTRELTAKGRRLFTEFVERIVKPNYVPSLVLHSPLTRTVQTAEILSKVTDMKSEQVRPEPLLGPGTSTARIVTSLEPLKVERLAVVGHNPDVGMLASYLVGGGSFDFKKGSIACIEFFDQVSPGLGRLAWFASPKLIVSE